MWRKSGHEAHVYSENDTSNKDAFDLKSTVWVGDLVRLKINARVLRSSMMMVKSSNNYNCIDDNLI